MASLLLVLTNLLIVCGAMATYKHDLYTDAELGGMSFTGDVLFECQAGSVLHCAGLCSQHESCATFTFDGDTCRGHEVIMTSNAPATAAVGAQSFVRASAVGAPGVSATCEGLHRFLCDDGSCISYASVCNGTAECSGLEDEQNCSECRPGDIPHIYLCDDDFDCYDASDEVNCPATANCSSLHLWDCGDGSCTYVDSRCDGETDCYNGSDEMNCAGCFYGDFRCGNGSCIEEFRVCDTVSDCADGSDEVNCQP